MVLGPTNIASTLPFDASQTYSKNVQNFVSSLMRDDGFTIDMDDEVTSGTLLARGGEIVHPRVRQAFGMPELAAEVPPPAEQAEADARPAAAESEVAE